MTSRRKSTGRMATCRRRVATGMRSAAYVMLASILCLGMCAPCIAFGKSKDAPGYVLGTDDDGIIVAPDENGAYPDGVWTDQESGADAKTEVGVYAIPPAIEGGTEGDSGSIDDIIDSIIGSRNRAAGVDGGLAVEVSNAYIGLKYRWEVSCMGKTTSLVPPTTIPTDSISDDGTAIVKCKDEALEYLRENYNEINKAAEDNGFVDCIFRCILVSKEGHDLSSTGSQYEIKFTILPKDSDYQDRDGTRADTPSEQPGDDELKFTLPDGSVEIAVSGKIHKNAKLVVVKVEQDDNLDRWNKFQDAAEALGDYSVLGMYRIYLVVTKSDGTEDTVTEAFLPDLDVHMRHKGVGSTGEWEYADAALFMTDNNDGTHTVSSLTLTKAPNKDWAYFTTDKLGYFAFVAKNGGNNPGEEGTKHQVTVRVGAHGTVVGITGGMRVYNVVDGDSLKLQVKPDDHYKIKAITSDGARVPVIWSDDTLVVGPVKASGTVNVSFEYVSYGPDDPNYPGDPDDPNNPNNPDNPDYVANPKVTAVVEDGSIGRGSVQAVGSGTAGLAGDASEVNVTRGDPAQVIISPKAGYKVRNVRVEPTAGGYDGMSWAGNALHFSAVDRNITVYVSFEAGSSPTPTTWNTVLTWNPKEGGSITGASTGIPTSQSGVFTIHAKDGYTVDSSNIDGVDAKAQLVYKGDGVWTCTIAYNGQQTRAFHVEFVKGERPANPGGNDPNNPGGNDPAGSEFTVDLSISGNGHVWAVVSNNGMIESVEDLNSTARFLPTQRVAAATPLTNVSQSDSGALRGSAEATLADGAYLSRASDMFSTSTKLHLTPKSTVTFVLLPRNGNHIESVLKNGVDAGVGDTHVLTHTADGTDDRQSLAVSFKEGELSDKVIKDYLNSLGGNGTNGNGSGSGTGGAGSLTGVKTPTNIGSGLSQTGDPMWMAMLALLALAIASVVAIAIGRKRSVEAAKANPAQASAVRSAPDPLLNVAEKARKSVADMAAGSANKKGDS